MKSNSYHTYIISNSLRTVLYVGVTNNLQRRIFEHKNGLIDGFSKKYKLNILLHFETYESINEAIAREKQLKSWRRLWKVDLIRASNPDLKDVSEDW